MIISTLVKPLTSKHVAGSVRLQSTLAERMKRAASSGGYESEEDQRHRLEVQVDEQVNDLLMLEAVEYMKYLG